MLGDKEFEALFAAAREAGLANVEVYCEESQSVLVQFKGRTDEIRYSIRRGMSLRAVREGVNLQFFSDNNDPRSLLAALRGEPPPAFASSPAGSEKLDSVLGEGASGFLQCARGAFSTQSERLTFPDIQATFGRRRYQVAQEGGAVSEGTEESAELHAEWFIDGKVYNWERARGSISGLLEEAGSTEGLTTAVRQSLATTPRWPAPQGRLSVLWSPRSVAKLQVLFLRALEGDRVLDNRSFLTTQELPLALRFSLEDRPNLHQSAVDHEGSPRRTMTLLREGRPTALACNRRVAEMLEVPATGHARRASFESPATLGFWHTHLEATSPEQTSDSLLAGMEKGISVRDIEILDFDSTSGDVALRLTQAYLVHNGAEGEAMEAVDWRLPLLLLLESWEGFESARQTTGLAVGKQSQRLTVEVTAPAALSRPLPLPGSVPPNHYW